MLSRSLGNDISLVLPVLELPSLSTPFQKTINKKTKKTKNDKGEPLEHYIKNPRLQRLRDDQGMARGKTFRSGDLDSSSKFNPSWLIMDVKIDLPDIALLIEVEGVMYHVFHHSSVASFSLSLSLSRCGCGDECAALNELLCCLVCFAHCSCGEVG